MNAKRRVRLDAGPAYALLNVLAPPFDDVRVRRALNYAVDRGRFAEFMGASQTHKPTCKMLPPGFQGYTPSCPFHGRPQPRRYLEGPRPGQMHVGSSPPPGRAA